VLTRVGSIIAAAVVLAGIVGTVTAVNGHIATKAEVRQVSDRFDRHLLEQERAAIQKRVWDMEDRWTERFWTDQGRGPADMTELLAWMPPEARDQYRDLMERLRILDERLDK